jgi:acetoacetate decarboxylase
MEFNKLIQDELRYISEMEDIELNRDWSQPKKFKSSDLIQHKLVKLIDLKLANLTEHVHFFFI